MPDNPRTINNEYKLHEVTIECNAMQRSFSAKRITLTLIYAAVAGFALSTLTSCVSMSAAECQYQDWHAKGLIDGMQGKTSAQFLRYARACDKHGMQPNQQDYMSGRNEGLKHFCTRETGFDQGIGNNEYHGVCPVAIEQQFLSGYHIGREMFVARNRVQNIDSTITYNQIQIARLQKDVVSLEKKIIDSESEESTRQGNLDAIKRKTSRIGALRQQIYEMRGDRPEAVRQCQEVRSRVYQQGFSTSSQCD